MVWRQRQARTRRRSRVPTRVELLVCLPFCEGRRSAERRIVTRRGVSPGSPGNRGTRQRLPALRRGVLKPWSVLPGTWLDGDFAPPPVPVQPRTVADPYSGAGRKPRASRACACEAQPQAPHPAGLGYPAPAKLSLCPTSGSPLEAPLTGQDGKEYKPSRKKSK